MLLSLYKVGVLAGKPPGAGSVSAAYNRLSHLPLPPIGLCCLCTDFPGIFDVLSICNRHRTHWCLRIKPLAISLSSWSCRCQSLPRCLAWDRWRTARAPALHCSQPGNEHIGAEPAAHFGSAHHHLDHVLHNSPHHLCIHFPMALSGDAWGPNLKFHHRHGRAFGWSSGIQLAQTIQEDCLGECGAESW